MKYIGIIAKIAAELETLKGRSAWDKGVTLYAWELLDEIQERADYEHKEPETTAELTEYALNGAESWEQYSWGGSALIYNGDIAGRPNSKRRATGSADRTAGKIGLTLKPAHYPRLITGSGVSSSMCGRREK